jgi:hypothetical protein
MLYALNPHSSAEKLGLTLMDNYLPMGSLDQGLDVLQVCMCVFVCVCICMGVCVFNPLYLFYIMYVTHSLYPLYPLYILYTHIQIMRNIHVFVSRFTYNMNMQQFVEFR